MADNLRFLLDIVALLAVTFAIVKGIFSAGATAAQLKAEGEATKKRFEQIERWIAGHQICSDKHEQLLLEVRDAMAYMRGQNERN
jgi:hypothetical protein